MSDVDLSNEALDRIEAACADDNGDELFSTVTTATVIALVAALREARGAAENNATIAERTDQIRFGIACERDALRAEVERLRVERFSFVYAANGVAETSGWAWTAALSRACGKIEVLRAAMPDETVINIVHAWLRGATMGGGNYVRVAGWLSRVEAARKGVADV